MKCGICKNHELESPVDRQIEACRYCADMHGIRPLAPTTRPRKACTMCGGLKFLRAAPRELTYGEASPMWMTLVPMVNAWSQSHPAPLDPRQGWGALEAYACYTCGHVEWFCSDVASIPIHPHLMTEVVDYGTGGPYR